MCDDCIARAARGSSATQSLHGLSSAALKGLGTLMIHFARRTLVPTFFAVSRSLLSKAQRSAKQSSQFTCPSGYCCGHVCVIDHGLGSSQHTAGGADCPSANCISFMRHLQSTPLLHVLPVFRLFASLILRSSYPLPHDSASRYHLVASIGSTPNRITEK